MVVEDLIDGIMVDPCIAGDTNGPSLRSSVGIGGEGVSGVTGVPNWMGYRPRAFLHRKAARSRSCPRSPRSQRPSPFGSSAKA